MVDKDGWTIAHLATVRESKVTTCDQSVSYKSIIINETIIKDSEITKTLFIEFLVIL